MPTPLQVPRLAGCWHTAAGRLQMKACRVLCAYARAREVLRTTHLDSVHTDADLAQHILDRYKTASGTNSNSEVFHKKLTSLKSDVLQYDGIASTKTYNAMLQVAARMRGTEFAESIWQDMEQRNIPTDQWSYVSLASAYASIGKVDRVKELLPEERRGSNAAKGVYLRALAKARRTDEMMGAFRDMLDKGFGFSRRHFVVLLSGQSDPAKALELLCSMRNHYGLQPNTLSCNAALGVCIHYADVEVADEILLFMQKSGIQKDQTTLSSLCALYAAAKRLDHLEGICMDVVNSKGSLTMHMYMSYIRCCANLVGEGNDVKRHVELAEAMFMQAVQGGFNHAPHIYTNMLEVYVLVDDDAKVQRLLEMMQAEKAKPSAAFRSLLAEHTGRHMSETPRGLAPPEPSTSGAAAEERSRMFPIQVSDPSVTPFFDVNLDRARAQAVRTARRVRAKKAAAKSPLFDSADERSEIVNGVRNQNMRLAHTPENTWMWKPRQEEEEGLDIMTVTEWRHGNRKLGDDGKWQRRRARPTAEELKEREKQKAAQGSWKTEWVKI